MKNVDLRLLTNHLQKFLQPSKTRKLLLVRSAESQGNLSGTITGWMDVRLTDFGRKQAFMLNSVYEQHAHLITQVHSSDLKRCYDTAFYACGFPSDENLIR